MVLVAPSSVTHYFNTNQRAIKLKMSVNILTKTITATVSDALISCCILSDLPCDTLFPLTEVLNLLSPPPHLAISVTTI